MPQLFTNNASALLVSDTQAGDTTITLGPGDGSLFPLPDAGDVDSFAILTLEDTGGNYEIVKMTERNGDILTIERGQEGTTAAGFATGSRIELRLTADTLDEFVQVSEKNDLRGQTSDVDSVRYWHILDPSTYQYWEYQYTTNVFGIPVMQAVPPPGLPNISWGVSVTAPDGGRRWAWLSGLFSSDANQPATNEVVFSVPGVLSLEEVSGALTGERAFISLDDNPGKAGALLLKTQVTDREISYSWTCRDDAGVERFISLTSEGWGNFDTGLILRNKSASTYSDADQVQFRHVVDPNAAGSGDVLFVEKQAGESNVRNMQYQFLTREIDTTQNPNVAVEKTVQLRQGKVRLPDTTISAFTDDKDVVTKEYVDSLSVGGTTPGDPTVPAVYGRDVIFNNGGGVEPIDGAQTLLAGKDLTDYSQITIITWDTSTTHHMMFTFDVETMVNVLGYGVWWDVGRTQNKDRQNSMAIRFNNATTFELQGLGNAWGTNIIRLRTIVGAFPVAV